MRRGLTPAHRRAVAFGRMAGLLRSNFVVAGGTALSRITGLLRLITLGYVLGQSALSDAYLLANETPNIVYDLLLGGLLSATLVPLFSTFVEQDDDESTNVVISVAVVLMGALTAVAVIAAPLIFGLYSLNIDDGVDPDVYRSVGTTLARIFLIQIFFYGLTGLANAFLNSRRRFFAAAWSPVLPNVVIIAALLSLPTPDADGWQLGDVLTDDRLRWTLGLGATAGIASMALVLLPAMARTGFAFRPNFDVRHPAVRKLLSLSFWTIGFVVANQVALLVVRNLAEPGSSDASAYINAFTFFVLPRPAGGVDRHHVPARDVPVGGASGSQRLRRPGVPGIADDGTVHDSRRCGHLRAASADHRRPAPAR